MTLRPITKIYDLVAITLIIVLSVILLTNQDALTQQMEDANYHLLVGQNFNRAGGIVSWEFWQSPPDGRPHLYPPLIHVLASFLVKTSITPFAAVKTITFFGIIISILLAWLGVRKLFDTPTALIFLLLTLSYEFYIRNLGIIVPASLVIAATPWLIFLIKNDKKIGSVALLTLMFYTHMIMPWFVVATVIVWAMVHREKIKTVGWTVIGSVILYSPWLIHILINNRFVRYAEKQTSVYENSSLDLNLFIIAIFLLATLITIWRWEKIKHYLGDADFFLILTIVQLPILASSYPFRFLASGGAFGLMILSAIILSAWQKSTNSRAILVTIIILIAIGQIFSIEIFTQNEKFRWTIARGALLDYVVKRPEAGSYLTNPYENKDIITVAQKIAAVSDPNDYIFSLTNVFDIVSVAPEKKYIIAQLFAAQSSRNLMNYRWPEYFFRNEPSADQAKIILADRLSFVPPANFTFLDSVGRTVVYVNSGNAVLKATPLKPIINQWLALILILAALSLIGQDLATAKLK